MAEEELARITTSASRRVIGVVSIGDLVKYRIDRIEADAEAMRTYIQSA